jgi:hypothetical protein
VSIGVANKTQCLQRSWALLNDLKLNEASFATILTDLLYLRVAQMPRCPDLAIFVLTNGQTEPIALPLAHARGVNIKGSIKAHQGEGGAAPL